MPYGRELARLRRSGQGDGLSESRGVLKDTGPVVRFAARAQQPAALNDVIEATTSEFVKVFGHGTMSELSPLSGVKRKLDFGAVRAAFDPQPTLESEAPRVRHTHRDRLPHTWIKDLSMRRFRDHPGGARRPTSASNTSRSMFKPSQSARSRERNARSDGMRISSMPGRRGVALIRSISCVTRRLKTAAIPTRSGRKAMNR